MKKRLSRSQNDQIVAGVCSGIANYFEVDPTLVRIIFGVAFFGAGMGLMLYIILWIVLPIDITTFNNTTMNTDMNEENENQEKTNDMKQSFNYRKPNNNNNRVVGGMVLIVLGVLFLMDSLFDIDFHKYWPVILIVIGLGILVEQLKKNNENK